MCVKIMQKQNEKFEIIEALENAIVVYDNGEKELFDAVFVTEKGVITGCILQGQTNKKKHARISKEFIGSGFIPKDNIKKINGTRRKLLRRNTI